MLSILSLNDLHGRLGALPAFGGYVEALRRAHGERGSVLVVDAGDLFQGTIGSNQSEGKTMIDAYNALGVAAAALGNHEFDYGPLDADRGPGARAPQGALRARLAEARFPVLSANLVGADGALPRWTNLFSRVLLERDGLRIGVVGVLTSETPSIVMPDYFAGLDVTALAPAVIEQAEALRAEGAEVVLGLAHAGAECAKFEDPHDLSSCDGESSELFRLVRAVPRGLVDAWFGGHTHAGVAHFVNGAPVVEALARGKAFGRIDLVLSGSPRRVLRARPFPPEPLCPDTAELAPCPTHPYAGLAVREAEQVARVVEPALAASRTLRARPLGAVLAETLPNDHERESALGNLFVDLMRAHVPGADVALANGGSLRAPLRAGALDYGALYDTMPFDNRLVTLELSASELARVLAGHLSHDAHGIVALSGVTAEASCQGAELRVSLRRANGRPLAPDERLKLVTSDYLATGGDRLLLPLGEPRARMTPVAETLVRDALAAELAKRGRIAARELFDPAKPRLGLPRARPVRCPPGQASRR